jgi:peptidoglycan-N-acetylglucosamine deacetylase
MGNGPTALTDRPPPRGVFSEPARRRTWSREPHHRRRRAIAALIVLLLVALLVALVVVGSGGGSRPLVPPATGTFFKQIQTLAGAGPGSIQAAEDAGIDRTLAYTPYVRVAGAQHRELALTFDDGPGPYTPHVLAILKRDNVPATFFEVGVLERYFHASTRAIVAQGDAIGDHTFYHAPMGKLPPVRQQAELLQDAGALQQYGSSFPRLFRPPFGLWNLPTLALLHRYRMLMVLWTVDTNDYRLPGSAAIVRSVLAGARPGGIVLLHDGGGNRSETVAALPAIIAKLRARGYRLVTVPKLLIDNPPPRNQKISTVIGHGG